MFPSLRCPPRGQTPDTPTRVLTTLQFSWKPKCCSWGHVSWPSHECPSCSLGGCASIQRIREGHDSRCQAMLLLPVAPSGQAWPARLWNQRPAQPAHTQSATLTSLLCNWGTGALWGGLLQTPLLRDTVSSLSGAGKMDAWALSSLLASPFPFVLFLRNLSLYPLLPILIFSLYIPFFSSPLSLPFVVHPNHSLTLFSSPVPLLLPPLSNPFSSSFSPSAISVVRGLPKSCSKAPQPAAVAPGVQVAAPVSMKPRRQHSGIAAVRTGGGAGYFLYAHSCKDSFWTSYQLDYCLWISSLRLSDTLMRNWRASFQIS